ncbi:MAG TPA: hypothetical protein VFQ63_01735 [Patescibacteria group bacterium]|nr:hypothetical protein [Patescibacteria group bacterium]
MSRSVERTWRHARITGSKPGVLDLIANYQRVYLVDAQYPVFRESLNEAVPLTPPATLADYAPFIFSQKSPVESSGYFRNLYQYVVARDGISELEGQVKGRQFAGKFLHPFEQKELEINKARAEGATLEIDDPTMEKLAIIQHLSEIPLPLTQEARAEIVGLFEVPQNQMDLAFQFALMDMGILGDEVFPLDIEKKYHYSPQVGKTFRHAGTVVQTAMYDYLHPCLDAMFGWQQGQKDTPAVDLPENTFFANTIATVLSLRTNYMLPSNFAQVLRAHFVPHMDEDFIERLITLQSEFFVTRFAGLLETKDTKGSKPYALVEDSYANGKDAALFDELAVAHGDDEPGVALPTLTEQITTDYNTITFKLLKKPPVSLEVNDGQIATIDVGVVHDNFIDMVVISPDGAAFALQIDERGRIMGIPQPYSENGEKVATYVLGIVTNFFMDNKWVKRPRERRVTEDSSPKMVQGNTNLARAVDRRPTQPPASRPNHEERKRMYEAEHADRAQEDDRQEPAVVLDQRARFLERMGLSAPMAQEEVAQRGFKLRFPAEAVKRIRKESPELEHVVRSALAKIREEIKASPAGKSGKLLPVETRDGYWRIKFEGEEGRFRIFLHEDGNGGLVVDSIERRVDTTYGRRFLDN